MDGEPQFWPGSADAEGPGMGMTDDHEKLKISIDI
jgi:hypothetical protein